MLLRLALVKSDISEERITSNIRVIKIGDLGTTLIVTSNRNMLRFLVTATVAPTSPILVILMMEVISSSETSGATRRNIPDYGILQSHARENLKSYTVAN
jgi:hypothetical protein